MDSMPKNKVTILEQMQNNFNKINFKNTQNNNNDSLIKNNQQNIETQGNSPNIMNNLSNLISLINALNNGKGLDIQSVLKSADIGNSNPMLSHIMSLLPNLKNNQTVKQQKQEKNEPKIDSFLKVDEYNIE